MMTADDIKQSITSKVEKHNLLYPVDKPLLIKALHDFIDLKDFTLDDKIKALTGIAPRQSRALVDEFLNSEDYNPKLRPHLENIVAVWNGSGSMVYPFFTLRWRGKGSKTAVSEAIQFTSNKLQEQQVKMMGVIKSPPTTTTSGDPKRTSDKIDFKNESPERELADLRREASIKQETLKDINQKLKVAQEAFEKARNEKAVAEEALAAKEREMTGHLTTRDAEIKARGDTIDRHLETISGLHEALAAKEREMTGHLTTRDAEIKARGDTIDRHLETISGLKEALAAKEREMTGHLTTRDAEIKARGDTIERHLETISGLQGALAAKDREMTAHLTTRDAEIKARGATIDRHLETISGLQGALTHTKQLVSAREAEVRNLQAALAAANAEKAAADARAAVAESKARFH